jgi:hypothetical protein
MSLDQADPFSRRPRLVDFYSRLNRLTAYQRFFTVINGCNTTGPSSCHGGLLRRLALIAEADVEAAAG